MRGLTAFLEMRSTGLEHYRIIDQLQQVKPNTTVYPEAQTLLNQAQSKLSQL